MGHIQSLDEFLSLLSRRRWLIAVIAIAGIMLSALYATSRPDVYQAAAVIQIEIPTVVEDGTTQLPSGAAQLLQAIEQRLTTRENLLAMIDRHGLFASLAGLKDDEKVNLLRQSVTFQSVASATGQQFGAPPSVSAIIVFARLDNADLAARVANDFAQGILDQSSAGQMDSARATTTFFAEEEARVSLAILGLEAEIADYKNANASALPALRDAQRDELTALDTDLRGLDRELLALESERATIDTGATLRATEKFRLDDIAAEVLVLQAQKSSLTDRRTQIEAELGATPEVERVLSGYERRLRQLQDQYDVITARMVEAETALRLAERKQAERFTLLERALTPEFSTGGGGRKVAVAGAFASLILAVALAFVLDLLNPVVRTADQMERELDLRPVISIPEVGSANPQRASRLYRLVDHPEKRIFGLPRYMVIAGVAVLTLVLAAAAIG